MIRASNRETGIIDEIGIPDEEAADDGISFQAGWTVPMLRYIAQVGDVVEYEYDFGDGWIHRVEVEAVGERTPGTRYPRCTGGERACPPEDCGGPYGYGEMLEALADRNHERHEEFMDFIGEDGCAPEAFHPKQVRFDDPNKRLKALLETR